MPPPLPHLVNYPLLRAAPWGVCLPGGVAAFILEDRVWALQFVESSAPSSVTWEGGPGPLSPSAPRARGNQTAAGGLEATGCRDLKWCPCRAVGGGGIRPSWSGAWIPTRCGSASGPGQDSSWRPEPAARFAITWVSREPLGVGARVGFAARRREGDPFKLGLTWLQSLESGRDRPLLCLHSPLPGSPGP